MQTWDAGIQVSNNEKQGNENGFKRMSVGYIDS